MSETELSTGTMKEHGGAFSAAEEHFFRQGDALESGELGQPDDLGERRLRPSSWRPRIVVVGCACVALLTFTLVGGKDPPAAAVAAVTFVPAAESAPLPSPALPAPEPAPAPAPPTVAEPPSAPAARAIEQRPAKKKAARGKRAHRQRMAARR